MQRERFPVRELNRKESEKHSFCVHVKISPETKTSTSTKHTPETLGKTSFKCKS